MRGLNDLNREHDLKLRQEKQAKKKRKNASQKKH